jgi:hypothetical protein
LEAFVLANLSGLAGDIYLAHSTNLFRDPWEYVPFYFSLVAPFVLLAANLALELRSSRQWWNVLGYVVGWGAAAVGIAGLFLHLESHFFRKLTLASLVYTAPFAAPLAYTGVGLLLILNRMTPPESREWPLGVLLLAWGGFLGNFIFSVADHAQNGFFYPDEWIPVVSSAFAVGILALPFLMPIRRGYFVPCAIVMLIQAAVGLLGFYYHVAADLRGPAPSLLDNVIYGAPVLAPLLFPNLAALTLLGLWVLYKHPSTNGINSPRGISPENSHSTS